MSDSFWIIKNCNLFAEMTGEDIRWLEQQASMRKLKRGEPVYLPSQEADGLLLVAKGRVKVCHMTPDGKQSILNFIDAGEVFGELAIVDNESRGEYVEASETTTLVLIPQRAILAVIQKYPQVVIGVTKLIGLRRQRIERRLRNLLFRSNRERVVHLLLELAEKYGQAAGTGIELSIRLSHQEMASIIGSTRETVTVVLGQLQNEGMIKISRRRIGIISPAKLAADVNEQPPSLGGTQPLTKNGSHKSSINRVVPVHGS